MTTKTRMPGGRFAGLLVLAVGLGGAVFIAAVETRGAEDSATASAREILDASGIGGGVIVHLGCGDGRLTAALGQCEGDAGAAGPFVVHGLDRDADQVRAARKHIASMGIYGRVSVERFDGGRLPYADNMVNLIVAEEPSDVTLDELHRVLVPGGVAYRKQDGRWQKTIKPWPEAIDEWTHWLHDAGNNPVARDAQVGPPQRMQWVVEPLWSRGHEVPSSVGACISARGRIFYVLDEGQPGVYAMPARWTLIARDAFNGVLLWKRPVPGWGAPLQTGGFHSGFRPRRLVTDGQRLYLPTGEQDVLTAVDAASGRILAVQEEMPGTEEILCGDGVMVAVAHPSNQAARRGRSGAAAIVGLRADSLEMLWQAPIAGLIVQTTALSDGHVFCATGQTVIALDARTGRELWRTKLDDTLPEGKRGGGRKLLVDGPIVYFRGNAALHALSAESGAVVWQNRGLGGDVFAAAGLLWLVRGSKIVGLDPNTGNSQHSTDASAVFSRGHHPRCYPAKATDRYLITPNRGAEFISLATDEQTQNDWLRGNCGHGVMPANGLLYAPPCQCFCYGGVILTGFKALASGPVPRCDGPKEGESRLERGPAYGEGPPAGQGDGDWPMYRRNSARLGSTGTGVPAQVAMLWQAQLGGRLTQPVVGGDTLLVAAVDAHTVHAFDAKRGSPLWSFTAGGRIDSSPTIYRGLVLFGSADGWTYCLRATDGELVWRYQAAPELRRIGAFGQLESAWPVHGSVVIHQRIAYFTAGRSTHLDGGIYAYGVEPQTGQLLHYARLDGAVLPEDAVAVKNNSENRQFLPAFHVEGARTDLLVSDGEFLYLGPLKFDGRLVRQPTPYVTVEPGETEAMDLTQAPYVDTGIFRMGLERKRDTDFPSLGVLRGPLGDKQMGLRLCATGGFLDSSWFNRTYWMYSRVWPGYYIAHLGAKSGQLLVVDETMTYGVQAYPSRTIHSPKYTPGTTGYLLFADDNRNEPVLDDRARGRDKGMGFTRNAPPKWFHWVPLRIRAMVAAGETLFAAGPPDVVPTDDPYAAFEGRLGAKLLAFSTADGNRLAEYSLDSPPVFDGMAAAGGRLFVSTVDGKVVCLGAGSE